MLVVGYTMCVFRLPEVPPDTGQTNTLLDVQHLPDWPKITPASAIRACGKLAILYETKVSDHTDKLKGKPTLQI